MSANSTRAATRENLLQEALHLHHRFDMTIIPLRHDTHTKRPAVRWQRYQSQRPTPQRLTEWFRTLPTVTGMAVIGGSASGGLVCRDFDTAQGYFDWAQAHAQLAHSLPTVRTRNGYHVVFRTHPQYQVFRTYTDRDPYGKGEYRGTCKQYWVLPPSQHPKGGYYEWHRPLGNDVPLVEDPVGVGLLVLPPLALSVTTSSSPRPPLLGTEFNTYLTVRSRWARTLPPGKREGWRWPDTVEAAIKKTPVVRKGTRHARQLVLIRGLLRTNVKWDQTRLWLVFKRWYLLNARHIAAPLQQAWKLYLDAFCRCEEPPKELDVERLREEASAIVREFRFVRNPKQRSLLAACHVLQRDNEGKSFFIKLEDVGRYLGLTETGGQYCMERLISLGYVEQLSRGSNFEHRANTYRVLDY